MTEQKKLDCPCGSGKSFSECHGLAASPTPPKTDLKLIESAPTDLLKLDLAAGQSPRDGFEGVDLYAPEAKHKVDLWKFPWPWADGSVEELHCSHHIEHIPAREIVASDIVPGTPTDVAAKFIGKDMFFAFFDECWRILKLDGWMQVICPSARSNRAFQDPTHRRFIVQETFLYLNADWRKMNKLDHYNVKCHFGCDVNSTVDASISMRAPEVQTEMMNQRWNVVYDWICKLQKKPIL